MNTAAKGRRNEYKTIELYERLGYQCTRSAASKGTWDVIAWDAQGVVFIQSKSNSWPGAAEMELLREAVVPPGARKFIHRWDDGKRLPVVKEV